jgi:hypothetical protein
MGHPRGTPSPALRLQVLLVLLGSLQKMLEHAQHALEHMQQRWAVSRQGKAAGGSSAQLQPQMSRRTMEAVDTMLERAQQLAGKGIEQVCVCVWGGGI